MPFSGFPRPARWLLLLLLLCLPFERAEARLQPDSGLEGAQTYPQSLASAARPSHAPFALAVSVKQPSPAATDPVVSEIISHILSDTLRGQVAGLSGEQTVEIGGEPFTLATRYSGSGDYILKATQYAYETFQSYGLQVSYFSYNTDHYGLLRDVIAEQPGDSLPECLYLLTAHLDDTNFATPETFAPGADDNASGSAAVLVAAQILSQYNFPCTIRYALFTGEEQGLYGSLAYAEALVQQGETLQGVLNMDMIGYNSDSNQNLDLHVRSRLPGSLALANLYSQVVQDYQIDLDPETLVDETLGDYSDNRAFWDQDYPAILIIEDNADFNPNYHTTADLLKNLDLTYYAAAARAATGSLAQLALHPGGVLTGVVSQPGSVDPYPGVQVGIGFPSGETWSTVSNQYGQYAFALPSGVYTVTAYLTGFQPVIIPGVSVQYGQTTQLDIPVECELSVESAAFSFSPQQPLPGAAVSFSGSAALNLPGEITYTWDFGDGSPPVSGSDLTSVQHSYPFSPYPIPYPVTMSVHSGCSIPRVVSHTVPVIPRHQFLPFTWH